MKAKKIVTCVLLLGLVGTLSACKGNTKTLTKQEINWSNNNELTTLDISKAIDSTSIATLVNVGEGLYRMNASQKPEPALVNKEIRSKDGKHYDFYLKKTKWSNGEELTAKDFIYSYKRTVDPETKSQLAGNLSILKNAVAIIKKSKKVDQLGVTAPSKDHLHFDLEKPISTSNLNSMLTLPYFFPQNKKAIKKFGNHYGTAAKYFIANGPFKITKWTVGEKDWVLVKNNNYFDEKNVKLKRINEEYDASSVTSYNLYKNGKIDNTFLDPGQMQFNEHKKDLHTYVTYAENRVDFNFKKNIFKNLNIRKAFSLAINRTELLKTIHNKSLPALGLVPENIMKNPKTGVSFARDSYVPGSVGYDLAYAKKLWKKGKEEEHIKKLNIVLLTNDTDLSEEMGEYIQSNFSKLPGLNVKVQHVPVVQQRQLALAGKYDLDLTTASPFIPSVAPILNIFSSRSIQNPGWSNKEFDTKLKRGVDNKTNNEMTQYNNFLSAEKILMKDQATIPLLQIRSSMLINPKVKGLVFMPNSGNFDLKSAYIK